MQAIKPGDFGLATHRYSQHDAVVPMGTKPKDLEKRELWTHVAGSLRLGDEIRVQPEDGAFVARLFVCFVSGTAVKVKLMSLTEMEQIDYSKEQTTGFEYSVKYRGRAGWCIIHTSSKEVHTKGLESEEIAHRELSNLKRALAA